MTVTVGATTAKRQALPVSYLAWVAGALASQLGSAAMYFALGWAASVYGGAAAGFVISLVVLPRSVLLLLGGAVGDRVGARRLMIICDAGMLAVAVVLAVCTDLIGTPLVMLLVAGLLIGVNDAFYLPSSGSMPRRLVDKPQLGRALALRQSGAQTVAIVGGPLGGTLVAFGGFAAAAWVNAATFAVVLVVLVLIRPRFTVLEAAARKHILREAAEGVRVALTTPGLGVALMLVAVAAGFILPVGSLLVPLLARSNAISAGGAGTIVGAIGAGTVLVTLVVAKVGTHRRPGLLACTGLLITAAGDVALAAAPAVGWAVAGALVAGAGSGVFVAHITPIMLSAAPETHLARVQALFSLVQSLSMLVTTSLLGLSATMLGAPTTIVACAAVLTLCSVIAICSRRVRRLA